MGTQKRTIVLKGRPTVPKKHALVPAKVDFPTVLEAPSNHLPTISRLKRVHGPLAFRQLMGVSAIKMRRLLIAAGYNIEHHQVIYTWERAERDPRNLPHRYWQERYMPDGAIDTYHMLIMAFVSFISRGAYCARVSGKRLWRVQLRRVQ